LIQLGEHAVESVQDLMFCLNNAKPQETVKAVVLRDGKRVEMKVTYQEKGGSRPNPHGDASPAPAADPGHAGAPSPGQPAPPAASSGPKP